MRGMIKTSQGDINWRKSKRQVKKNLLKSTHDALSGITSPYQYWRKQFDHPGARFVRNWF